MTQIPLLSSSPPVPAIVPLPTAEGDGVVTGAELTFDGLMAMGESAGGDLPSTKAEDALPLGDANQAAFQMAFAMVVPFDWSGCATPVAAGDGDPTFVSDPDSALDECTFPTAANVTPADGEPAGPETPWALLDALPQSPSFGLVAGSGLNDAPLEHSADPPTPRTDGAPVLQGPPLDGHVVPVPAKDGLDTAVADSKVKTPQDTVSMARDPEHQPDGAAGVTLDPVLDVPPLVAPPETRQPAVPHPGKTGSHPVPAPDQRQAGPFVAPADPAADPGSAAEAGPDRNGSDTTGARVDTGSAKSDHRAQPAEAARAAVVSHRERMIRDSWSAQADARPLDVDDPGRMVIQADAEVLPSQPGTPTGPDTFHRADVDKPAGQDTSLAPGPMEKLTADPTKPMQPEITAAITPTSHLRPEVAAPPSPQAPPPPPMTTQIAQAVTSSGETVTELRLSPEELGAVRIDLRSEGDRLVLHVSAERQDTLDLLRRHADRLLAELRGSGFSQLDLGFGQWGSDRPAQPPIPIAISDADPADDWQAAPLPPSTAPRTITPTSGLDLRL